MSYKILTRDEHYANPGPKRILAIDGGGLRGILSLAMLKQIEAILKERHGDEFRLSHYFDMMAGTSTGSIIAASLALGMTVSDVTDKYNALGHQVFKKSLFRKGFIRARYNKNKLVSALKDTFGEETDMGSKDIQTGLLVMTKRIDTGSPWPITNNPNGKYFSTDPNSGTIPNKNYPLWQVVRASTAAPTFFKGINIEIKAQEGKKPVVGMFVDGGVSPFNNPALQAFMYATLEGHNVNWPTGQDKILMVSLGTGSRDPKVETTFFEASNAIKSLVSMMDDCNALVQTMLQWMSSGPSAITIGSVIGNLENDLIAGRPLLSYLRYDVKLSGQYVSSELGLQLDDKTLKSLSKMDIPANMPALEKIGSVAGEKIIRTEDFPAGFDLSNADAPNQVV